MAIREVKELPLSSLVIGQGQVRLRDVDKDIDELATSIKKVGLLEPIVVCEAEDGRYEIITGQRRFLAHQKLGFDTILAAILDERVSETEAKVLSLTENLIRRDLNTKDLIDVCTELYKRYGTFESVAEETGLPARRVSQYVKYEQLTPKLKELVDAGSVPLPTALRAQKAATAEDKINEDEAVELAKEMAPMSGAQQEKIVTDRGKNPSIPVDEVIENAKSGGKITQISVTLTSSAHTSLKTYAESEDTTLDDAARMLIEGGLSNRGFLSNE